jgi:ankyrin repeat protein
MERLSHVYELTGKGYARAADALLASKADVNARDFAQRTPLHLAAVARNDAVMARLLANGADVKATAPDPMGKFMGPAGKEGTGQVETGKGQTALHMAAAQRQPGQGEFFAIVMAAREQNRMEGRIALPWYDNAGTVKLLLKHGAPVNARDERGRTPLHLAAKDAFADVAKILVDNGADISAKAQRGRTPLHEVVDLLRARSDDEHFMIEPSRTYGDRLRQAFEIAELLCERGADPMLFAGKGQSGLHLAAELGLRKLTESRLAKGDDLEVRDGKERTPLLVALGKLGGTKPGDHKDVVRLLLSKGADVKARAKGGCNALCLAAMGGDVEVVKWVLAKGADVRYVCRDEHSHSQAIHHAASGGHHDVVIVLLDKGADVNARNGSKETPLHLAVRWSDGRYVKGDHLSVIAALLRRGADTNARDAYGSTPLHEAGRADVVKLLLKHGADTSIKNGQGATALEWAVRGENKEVAALLQGAGSKLDLFGAVRTGDVEKVRTALKQAPDTLNAKDEKHGSTALHEAIRCREPKIVQFLLAEGATVDAQNKRGETPLHMAADAADTEMLRLLLAKGVDTGVKDKSGETPLEAAIPRGWGAKARPEHEVAVRLTAGSNVIRVHSLISAPLPPAVF